VTKDMLEQAGIVAHFAENGVDGVRAVLENGPYDAVLMDVQMPRMDGYTATRLIRANPGFADMPIIALTANAMQGDRDAALTAGMNDYITKPVDPDEALLTLARWVRPGAAAIREPSTGVLDRTAGLRRSGGNQALYDKIVARFAEDARQFTTTFRTVHGSGDLVHATRLAHSLKSSAGTIGADEVQRAAARLEEYCRGSEAGGSAQAPVEDLERAIERLLSELAPVLDVPLGR
jgi:CheY-like chemotaxis protein